jgi:hypothetical protein
MFGIETAALLIMSTIGQMYNLKGSGTVFVDVIKGAVTSLALTGGIGIVLIIIAVCFFPKSLD